MPGEDRIATLSAMLEDVVVFFTARVESVRRDRGWESVACGVLLLLTFVFLERGQTLTKASLIIGTP